MLQSYDFLFNCWVFNCLIVFWGVQFSFQRIKIIKKFLSKEKKCQKSFFSKKKNMQKSFFLKKKCVSLQLQTKYKILCKRL